MTEPTPEARDTEPLSEERAASGPASDPWERIKEHKVLQWGLAYLGAALALAHGGDLLGHTFHWPEALNRLLLGVLIVGFPVALALAWYHGHRSLKTISTGEATIISILLVIGAGILVLFVRPPSETAQDATAVPAHTAAVTNSAPIHPTSAAGDSGPSIAVLPFVNMSSDREQEYFSDGLSEELLNELANVPNLRVIGRTSSFAFKGKNEDLRTIGETLGVNHILEGSVRKSADSLRITAQLINPVDGSHLWSGTYDRKLGDVFEIQEDIARTVASALRVSIEATNLSEGGTHNIEAYDEFLRASEASPLNAIPHLERAVQIDSQFTQAWAQLARAYRSARLFNPERDADWLKKAHSAEDRVLALAPNSTAAKILMARREMDAGKLLQAERLLESVHSLPTGITSGASVLYGYFLLAVGRSHDAHETLQAAQRADPVNGVTSALLQISLEMVGQFSEADEEYRRALAVVPDKSVIIGSAVVRAMALRDPVVLRKAVGGNTDPQSTDINHVMVALLGNAPAALAQLHRSSIDPNLPTEPVPLTVRAQWAAYFGDPDLSLQQLRRIPRDSGDTRLSVMFSLWRPVERNMRRLPGFKDFVRELGLLDYWRTSGNWGEFCHPLGTKDFECN
jgi:TolB-like protein